jgi:hypothetical protein
MAQYNIHFWNKQVFIFVLGLFLLSFSIAQNTNLTDQEYSAQCLFDSAKLMNELAEEGFNIFRIDDSLSKSKTIYDSQILIEKQGMIGEYGYVMDSCGEIAVLYELAIQSRDDLRVFVGFYSEVTEEGMDTVKVDAVVAEIEKEINDERYEKVEPLIEKAYTEISNAQEEFGRLNRFYSATTRSVTVILREYGFYLVILLAILFVLYLAYRVRIRKIILNRKIANIRLRKKSLLGLMTKTQKEYFQTGTISESDYRLRSKNFANLIRDIDRQIPLLEEKLIKADESKKNNERVKEIAEEEKKGKRRKKSK